MRNVGLIIGIVILIALVVLLTGGMGMMGVLQSSAGNFGMGPGMMNGGMMGSAYNPLGGVLAIVLSVVIIGGIALIVSTLMRENHTSSPLGSRETPLDILKARYARGEISAEQFMQMRKELEG